VKLSVAAGFSSCVRSCYRRWHWIHASSLGQGQGWLGSGVVGSRVDSRVTALGRWSAIRRASSLYSPWRWVAVVERRSVMQLAAGATSWAVDPVPWAVRS
jgi:hypothetical protein